MPSIRSATAPTPPLGDRLDGIEDELTIISSPLLHQLSARRAPIASHALMNAFGGGV